MARRRRTEKPQGDPYQLGIRALELFEEVRELEARAAEKALELSAVLGDLKEIRTGRPLDPIVLGGKLFYIRTNKRDASSGLPKHLLVRCDVER